MRHAGCLFDDQMWKGQMNFGRAMNSQWRMHAVRGPADNNGVAAAKASPRLGKPTVHAYVLYSQESQCCDTSVWDSRPRNSSHVLPMLTASMRGSMPSIVSGLV